jgi:hypothetical protein
MKENIHVQAIPYGAKVVYEELKIQFPGSKRKAGETETGTAKQEVKID